MSRLLYPYERRWGQIRRLCELRHARPCIYPVSIGGVGANAFASVVLSLDNRDSTGQYGQDLGEQHLGIPIAKSVVARCNGRAAIIAQGEIAERLRRDCGEKGTNAEVG